MAKKNHDVTKCDKLLCCVEQISEPKGAEDPGSPTAQSFYKPSDAKNRFLNLLASGGISYYLDDGEDEEIGDDDGFDDEVEYFNNVMSQTPYSVGSDGLANYERALTKNEEELKSLRSFMDLKDIPDFQEFMAQFSGLGRDEIASKLVALRSASENVSDEKRDAKTQSSKAGLSEDEEG